MKSTSDVRIDPITGQQFTVVRKQGHGPRKYASRRSQRLATRLSEVTRLIGELAWTPRGVSEMRSRLFGLLNQGPLRTRAKARPPMRVTLTPETWAELDRQAKVEGVRRAAYVESLLAERREAVDGPSVAE